MSDNCKHDKAYSTKILLSDPPQRPWICRKCLEQGNERSTFPLVEDGSEYQRLISSTKENSNKFTDLENPEFNLRCCKVLKLELVSDRTIPTYTIIWPDSTNDTWPVHKMKFHRSRDWVDLLIQECIKRNMTHKLFDELLAYSDFIFDIDLEDLADVALNVLEGNL